jgi:hypothetical protein
MSFTGFGWLISHIAGIVAEITPAVYSKETGKG